jgi:hypothetical protein
MVALTSDARGLLDQAHAVEPKEARSLGARTSPKHDGRKWIAPDRHGLPESLRHRQDSHEDDNDAGDAKDGDS